ncbi:hypothetical protein [Arthrobacter sp.]|uniref:hypothetical protein n=1 Tax=Arthrobacter sp. TaxID=1667 RepID=UPI0028117AC4|nr:hypothetical protein [Arthrobacter sp.]
MNEKHRSVGQSGPLPGVGSGVGSGASDVEAVSGAEEAAGAVVDGSAPSVVRPSPAPMQPEHASVSASPSAAHLPRTSAFSDTASSLG